MLEKLSRKEVNCWELFLVGEPHSEKPKVDSNTSLWKAQDFPVLWLFSNFAEIDHFSAEALGPGRIMQLMRKFSLRPQVLTDSDNKIPSLNIMCKELLATLKSPSSTTAMMWGRISHWGYSHACWQAGLSLPVASQQRWHHPHASSQPRYWLSLLQAPLICLLLLVWK